MSAAAGMLLAASLMWPFGSSPDSKKEPAPREGTLGTLQDEGTDLPPDAPPDAPKDDQASERARKSYELYLKQTQTDPKLAGESMRRLADLDLDNADQLESGNEARSEAYRKAAARYQELLKRYPDAPRNEQVLYQLARAQDGSGDSKAALETLGQLIKRYPDSPLMTEAHFRSGEILFAQHRYADAETAFAAVVALGAGTTTAGVQTSYYEPALYKQGWSRLKQDEFQGSLDLFFQLLDRRLGKVDATDMEAYLAALPRPERELIDDSIRAMALACVGLATPKPVGEQLSRHGDPSYGYLLYSQLAAIYLKQQRYSDVATTLTSFVETHPEHPQAPEFEMQAIAALDAGGFASQSFALREDYVRRFDLDQPVWKARKSGERNTAAVDYLRESTWMVAQQHHALTQNKSAKPADRAVDSAAAAENYRRYIRSFPKDVRAPQAQFLLGDVLYDSGDIAGAIAAYDSAAYDYPAYDRRADAGYAALQAYQKQEQASTGADRDASHRKRLTADLRFASTFRDRKEAAQVQSNAAAGLFDAGDLTPALAAARTVVKDPQSDDESKRVAWRVIGHASFDQKDYAGAEAAYLEFQKLSPKGAPPDKDISDRLAASIYRQGETAQEAGKSDQAAVLFSRVATEAPNTRIRVTADYDAAMATLKSGNATQAIPMLLAFRTAHAGEPLVPEVTRTLAATYEKTGQPREAAEELQRIADTPGTDPELQRQALWHSAELLQPVEPQAAQRALRQYVQRFPVPFDQAIEAYDKLIALAAARREPDVQNDWSAKLVKFEATGGDQRSERSRTLAAHAAMIPARAARDAYQSLKLALPLKTSLAAKRARLEQALNAYAAAAEYGVADVLTESTFETAELYHDLARALKTSERPKDLDTAALEQYDLLLDEQIFPFEDKAISIHEANARRAKDGIYDLWVQKSYAELAGLAPGRYGKGDLPELSVPAAPAGATVKPAATQAFDIAAADLQAGRYEAAAEGFQKLIKDYPTVPGSYVNLGLCYRFMNQTVDEEAALRQAVEKFPHFAPALHQLGVWQRRRGKFNEAENAYARAIAEDDNYLAAHYDRGVLNDLYLQRPQVALAEYEKYQSLLPEPDKSVARWIVDLKRRTGTPAAVEPAPEKTP